VISRAAAKQNERIVEPTRGEVAAKSGGFGVEQDFQYLWGRHVVRGRGSEMEVRAIQCRDAVRPESID
jgi:hypothetical protein